MIPLAHTITPAYIALALLGFAVAGAMLAFVYRTVANRAQSASRAAVASELTAADAALSQSEDRFRQLADSLPLIVWKTGADGNVSFLNRRWSEYTGVSTAGPGDSARVIHPDDIPRLAEAWSESRRGGNGFQLEFRLRPVGGDYRWFLARAAPVLDSTGAVSEWFGTSTDIHDQKMAEKSLRESRSILQLVLDYIPQGVFWKDRESRFLGCNRVVADAMGLADPLEIVGKTHAELSSLRAEEIEQFVQVDREVMKSGRPRAQIVERMTLADGSTIWLNTNKVPMRDVEGRVTGVLGTWEDVTERMRSEEELRRSEEQFRGAFEHTGVAMVLTDIDNRFVRVNAAFADLFGYAPGEMLGMTMAGITHPDDVAASLEQRVELIAGRHQFFQMEKRYFHKDGRILTALTSVSLVRAPDGRPALYVGQVQDITDRIAAEAALQLRDRAIRATTQGIVITDPTLPDNPVVYVSPAFEAMTGYPSEDMLGRNCRLIQGEATDKTAIRRVREAVRAEQFCTVELLNYRKDGSTFWNELSISPVRDGGGRLTHFVGMQTDVTERKRLELQFRQSQKMEAVGQLAGGIAHDFNNLLTIINGYSELLLQDSKPDDPTRELLSEILKAGLRSAGLTRQLLAFSRQQVLTPRVLDLNAVAGETEKMLRRVIGEDILLVTSLAPDLGAVLADAGQVEQVLLNLAVNARDAMPQGGRLLIETRNVAIDRECATEHPDLAPGQYVMLGVADTGTGMTPEVKAKIFEPFFTTKGPGQGTGLGLATVYGIIRQSNGQLEVVSSPGAGTRFRIYLPRVEGSAAEKPVKSGIRPPPRGTETILLVEDEDGVRALTRHVLDSCGYTVLDVVDGQEALLLMADGHAGTIDLLITDVVMPGLGGPAVAALVAERFPDIKILFVSGYTDDAVFRHGMSEEGVNFLQKPFSPPELAAKVRAVLDAPQKSAGDLR